MKAMSSTRIIVATVLIVILSFTCKSGKLTFKAAGAGEGPSNDLLDKGTNEQSFFGSILKHMFPFGGKVVSQQCRMGFIKIISRVACQS